MLPTPALQGAHSSGISVFRQEQEPLVLRQTLVPGYHHLPVWIVSVTWDVKTENTLQPKQLSVCFHGLQYV